jgi:hypothetical protein
MIFDNPVAVEVARNRKRGAETLLSKTFLENSQNKSLERIGSLPNRGQV